MSRVCKKCLLRDMEQVEKDKIEKYLKAIKQGDRVEDAIYEQRLEICQGCDRLNEGTCAACGCYVELRAAAKVAHCPKRYW